LQGSARLWRRYRERGIFGDWDNIKGCKKRNHMYLFANFGICTLGILHLKAAAAAGFAFLLDSTQNARQGL
jgi:hypothetical protein